MLVFIVATINGPSPSLRGAFATKQSTFIALEMDCFAEYIIGRAFARPVGSQ
jgi:hypothetical protein